MGGLTPIDLRAFMRELFDLLDDLLRIWHRPDLVGNRRSAARGARRVMAILREGDVDLLDCHPQLLPILSEIFSAVEKNIRIRDMSNTDRHDFQAFYDNRLRPIDGWLDIDCYLEIEAPVKVLFAELLPEGLCYWSTYDIEEADRRDRIELELNDTLWALDPGELGDQADALNCERFKVDQWLDQQIPSPRFVIEPTAVTEPPPAPLTDAPREVLKHFKGPLRKKIIHFLWSKKTVSAQEIHEAVWVPSGRQVELSSVDNLIWRVGDDIFDTEELSGRIEIVSHGDKLYTLRHDWPNMLPVVA